MIDGVLYILFTIIIFIIIFALSRNSIQDQISRKLKEDEKKSKDAEREKQQLRDEDKYDGNYKKRHL